MPARTGAHRNDAIDPLIDCFACMTNINDIMKHNTTVAVNGSDDFGRRAQARNDDRYLVLDAHFHVMLEPVIALVNDLIDGERRDG